MALQKSAAAFETYLEAKIITEKEDNLKEIEQDIQQLKKIIKKK
jgi:hypothetical protein